MLCRDFQVVEIRPDRRTVRVNFDPRWIENIPDLVDSLVIEAPVLVLLSWFSMPYLHGAALSYGDRGVILVGEQGSGKSTTAYACSRLGFSFHAEDYVFVRREGDDLFLVGNPLTLKLCEDTVTFFPHIAPFKRVRQPDGEVKIDVLPTLTTDQRRSKARLNGIVLLSKERQTEEVTTRHSLISSEALYSFMLQDLLFDAEGLEQRHGSIYRELSHMLSGVIPFTDRPEKRAELLLEMISR
jgi:hypothetical protein